MEFFSEQKPLPPWNLICQAGLQNIEHAYHLQASDKMQNDASQKRAILHANHIMYPKYPLNAGVPGGLCKNYVITCIYMYIHIRA